MNKIIKKRLLGIGMVVGMLITASPFLGFIMGLWQFLHCFGGIFSFPDQLGHFSAAPAYGMANGIMAFEISIGAANYLCPIGVIIMFVCLVLYASSSQKTSTSPPQNPSPQ